MLINLASYQVKQGYSVRIGCLLTEGPLADIARRNGIEVGCFHKTTALDIAAVLAMRRWLSSRKIDIIHSHNAVSHYYCAAASIGLQYRKLINTRHDMGQHSRSPRKTLLYRIAMLKTNYCVAVCEAARKVLIETREASKNKTVVIVNGIDTEKFEPRTETAGSALKARLGISQDFFIVGSVGRLNPVKQQSLMISATAELIKRGRKIALVIAGGGPLLARLHEQCEKLAVSEHVKLIGETEDIPKILAGLDVFLLTSQTEGYSMALVEASCTGLPIVATNVGGNAEIVQDHQTGILIEPDSVEALVKAIDELYNNSNLRDSLGTEGLKWAAINASTSGMFTRYHQLYLS